MHRSLRIALLTPSLSPAGGAEVYNRRLFEFLQAKGHVVDLITNDKTILDHATTRTYDVPRPTFQTVPVLWRLAPALRFCWYVSQARKLPIRRPDVIIGTADPLSCTLARRFPRARFIYLPHHLTLRADLSTVGYGSRWQRATSEWLGRRLESWTLNRADWTVRFSRFSAELMLLEYPGAVQPHFYFLAQSVEVPADWRSEPPGRPVRLLFVGRLIETKNCRLALEALAGLLDLDWTFDIVGDGLERASLEQQVRDLGLEGRVRFAGHQAETRSFYRSADLFLFPSKRENQPLVVLEAMCQGTPTLAIRRREPEYVNALDEVIVDGVNGYLADGEDGFRLQLESILRDPERMIGTAVRTQARKTAAQSHSATEVLEQFNAGLLRLVATPRPRDAAARKGKPGLSAADPSGPPRAISIPAQS